MSNCNVSLPFCVSMHCCTMWCPWVEITNEDNNTNNHNK